MAKQTRKQSQIEASRRGANGDNTPPQQRGLMPPWRPGESGNPAGRPNGARNKLAGSFIADLYANWQRYGVSAIERVAIEQPVAYLRLVASVVPKENEVENSRSLDELSDQDLLDVVDELKRMRARFHSGES